MRQLGLCVIAVLFNASVAFSQISDCSPAVQSVTIGAQVQIPMGHSQSSTVRFIENDETTPPNGNLGTLTGSTWSQEHVQTLSNLAAGDPLARIVWTTTGGTQCAQRLNIVPVSEPQDPPGRPATGADTYGADECDVAGKGWSDRVLANQRGTRATMLVFNHEGELCYPPPARPTQGDPIYVGVFTNSPLEWSGARIRFEPCSLEPNTPNVLATGNLGDFTSQLESGDWSIREFPVRQCWDSTVAINVSGPGDKRFSYALQQATRYRATVHLGTVFTHNHDVSFSLRTSSEGPRIFSQGPVEKGPEYVGALVFYSVLRYLPALTGGPSYLGRDPVADNTIVDKIGAVVGIGLEHPSGRFVSGFSFEVAAGINALGVWDWARVNRLHGVTEGSVFTGTASEIPTEQAWRRKFVFGISLDLIYAANVLRR